MKREKTQLSSKQRRREKESNICIKGPVYTHVSATGTNTILVMIYITVFNNNNSSFWRLNVQQETARQTGSKTDRQTDRQTE